MSNGVLFKRWKSSNRVNEVWQAVVPKSMRQEVLYKLHDAPTSGGHFAVEKTLARIRQRFWWPFMRSIVEQHIANCDRCAARSTAGKNRRAELQSTQVFNSFKVIAADILGSRDFGLEDQSEIHLSNLGPVHEVRSNCTVARHDGRHCS